MIDMTKKKEITPIDCNEAVKRFNDFLDNYLKGKERKELMNHVSTCRLCFDRLEFEQMLKAKIATLSNDDAGDKQKAKKQIEKILSKV
jgi:hypothetical protein